MFGGKIISRKFLVYILENENKRLYSYCDIVNLSRAVEATQNSMPTSERQS